MKKLSEQALMALEDLGNFGPTNNRQDKLVKGRGVDEWGETYGAYYNSADLRLMADGLMEAADWLDARAKR